VGLLLAVGIDFGMYSMTNIQNLTITVVDPPLAEIYFGIGGAVIGLMLGKGETGAGAAACSVTAGSTS
jgi:hypothetical protein|tara:strand:- start:19582 stop:19785 length:204 start_codon:yes stop_codon:yes gene_type:complete